MTLDLDLVRAALPAYEVGEELGRGGWGVVLAGRHVPLGREVAIKQLPRAFAADPGVRARFVAEARLLASLDHPHIVPVFDFVEVDGLCLLVMEKLPGGTLWRRFTTAGVTAEAACALLLAGCAGLHAAHQRGILHRDVKPENLLFSRTGVIKVTDFGISKVVGGDATVVTRSGEVLGTPAYMSPEQAQGSELGPTTDVYAAAVMLYELLSGRLPFADDADPLKVLYRHVYEQPRPLLEVTPSLPAAIAGVVMTALHTRPEDRYPSTEAFGVALAEAATAAWGPGWPQGRGEVAVMGAGPILAATERPSGGPPPAVALAPVPAPAPAPATVVSSPVPRPAVRPTVTVHARRLAPEDTSIVELLPVRLVLGRPPFPRRAAGRAAGLLALVIVLSVLGLGRPAPSGDLARGSVTVAGVDPVTGGVRLDLGEPVAVRAALGGPLAPGDDVQLRLTAAGLPLASASGRVGPSPGPGLGVALDLTASRYLVAGRATGELRLMRAGRTMARRRFGVRSHQGGFLTLPGLAGVAGLLCAGAYAESLLRSLRRGAKAVVGPPAMAGVGALLGLSAPVLAWAGLGREPTLL
ncbi:MAG: serine/threonine-protein kinase, partial [Acidimicrobiales bacterium]